jgi:5-(hydroxymethyl)furfural/furfural oxidase
MAPRLEADWVVVGGGTAGCVVASRLSEVSSRQVVLVEAGPDWRSADALPELRSVNFWRASTGEARSRFWWHGLEARRTSVQRPSPYPQGKGLGGSSTVNGLVALRATADDYARWAAIGCPGWSYEDVLPHLCRMESDNNFGSESYHGSDGPVPLMRLPRDDWGVLDQALADSALSLGYAWCEDYNAPAGTGLSPVALNVRDGIRVTTNDAYLEPARERSNLRILGDAVVERILLQGNRAVGVRTGGLDGPVEVRASHVVLCAGAINSPAILMRSGIGPDGPAVRLPVGEYLQDHPLARFWLRLRPYARPRDDDWLTNCRIRYTSGLHDAGENDMVIGTANRTPAGDVALLFVCLHQPMSRGSLAVAPHEPDASPAIEERLLEATSDLVRMRDGIRRALDLLAHPSLSAVVEDATIDSTRRGVDALTEDKAIDRWLLETVGSTSHISSTCPMGAPNSPRAVVDPRGRVLGVDGLYVADASVFPEVPRANTHFPTIAAAERLSDLMSSARLRVSPGPP